MYLTQPVSAIPGFIVKTNIKVYSFKRHTYTCLLMRSKVIKVLNSSGKLQCLCGLGDPLHWKISSFVNISERMAYVCDMSQDSISEFFQLLCYFLF